MSDTAHQPWPPGWPDKGWPCSFCSDGGLTGGKDGEPYRFCICEAGIARKREELNIVDEANETARKLGIVK